MVAIIRRFWLLFAVLVIVLVAGTIGFEVLEGLSFLDALYLTVMTITTVGYGDIHPTTTDGKIFSILLIVVGIGTFLTFITGITQVLVQRAQGQRHHHRLNMLIGVFFTEVGSRLLHLFAGADPERSEVCQDCQVKEGWTEPEFAHLKRRLRHYEYGLAPELLDLEALAGFLKDKGNLLLGEIENPDLLEHESFTELLWAVVHLRDELLARESLRDLPPTDLAHLANDIRRVYSLLGRQWADYLQYLKGRYPFLFSLALRTNPFVEKPSPVIR